MVLLRNTCLCIYNVHVCWFIRVHVHVCWSISSARDNVWSSDNFRPIYACDRLCAIMVGQNVRARDNARIINFIAYWAMGACACADNYFTLGEHPATLFIPRARLLGKANDSMGATSLFPGLSKGLGTRLGCNHMVFINSPLGLHNILFAKCSPRPLFWFPGYIIK